ncbi:MAG TPA: sterol desaturase family protein, partial [Gemmatimonadaceae bacterium]|nr:sterol desaturase family protein [Gemmatimonadaceae bacterium]
GLDLADRHATRAQRYDGERLRASSFAFLLVVIAAFLAIQLAGFALVPRVDGLVSWVRVHVARDIPMAATPHGWRLVLVAVALFYFSGLVDYAWHRWFSHNRWFWFTHESHHLPTQVFVGMPGLGVRPFAVLTVVPLVAFTAALTYVALRVAGRPMWDWTVFQLPLLISSTLLVTSHSSFMRRGWLAHRVMRWAALTTPQEHVLHHTTDLQGNYGNFTTLWDRLFGTYLDPRLAEHQNKRYGVAYDQDFLGTITAGRVKLPASWRRRFQLDRYLNIER